MLNHNIETIPYPTFNIKLKDIRMEKGLSTNKLSKLTGVSRSIISDLENGKYDNPTCLTIIRLTKGLNCRFEELIDIN